MTARNRRIAIAVTCVAVLGVAAWYVQRNYFPTCGQVGEHLNEVLVEADQIGPVILQMQPGPTRQMCIDESWPLEMRRTAMQLETEKQIREWIDRVSEEAQRRE